MRKSKIFFATFFLGWAMLAPGIVFASAKSSGIGKKDCEADTSGDGKFQGMSLNEKKVVGHASDGVPENTQSNASEDACNFACDDDNFDEYNYENIPTYGCCCFHKLPPKAAAPAQQINPCTKFPSSPTTIDNPLCSGNDIPTVIGKILKGFLGLMGILALLMFVWGGAQMMLSQGEAKKYEQGVQTLVWTGIGLAIVFGSYALVDYLLKTVMGGV